MTIAPYKETEKTGSCQAAQQAAMVYSFPGMCKINEVELSGGSDSPLGVIPDHPADQPEELLPVK